MPRRKRTTPERRRFEKDRKASWRHRTSASQTPAQSSNPSALRLEEEAWDSQIDSTALAVTDPEDNPYAPNRTLRSPLTQPDSPSIPGRVASELLPTIEAGSTILDDPFVSESAEDWSDQQDEDIAISRPDVIQQPSQEELTRSESITDRSIENLEVNSYITQDITYSPRIQTSVEDLSNDDNQDIEQLYKEDLSIIESEDLNEQASGGISGDEALLNRQIQGEASNSQDLDEPRIDLYEAFCQHLLQFQGCSQEDHQALYTQHETTRTVANHLPINGYPAFLASANCPRTGAETIMTTDFKVDCPQPNWRQIFEGQGPRLDDIIATEDEMVGERPDLESEASQDGTLTELCLDCCPAPTKPAVIQYDIDSFLGYANSLAFARQGLTITLYPRFQSNLASNLHIYSTVSYDFGRGEKLLKVKLHQVPHYCLGRVIGHENTSVYLFFPRMWAPEKRTNFPGKGTGEQHSTLKTWTDNILLPSLFRHVSPTSRQHFPSSWDQARCKAVAYNKERRNRNEKGDDTFKSLALHYDLHHSALAATWQDILRLTQDPIYEVYRGVQIFFSNKNTKLRLTSPSLAACWQDFSHSLSTTFDLTYLDQDRVWIDLGQEQTCTEYQPRASISDSDSIPTTYLLKACCQRSYARWALLGEERSAVKATYYPVAMLRDVMDMTLEMSQTSRQRQAGWLFSQSYNSYKEIFDAAKTKPFASASLAQLARDPLIDQMIRHQGRHFATTLKQTLEMYLASKSRLSTALIEARQFSFGTREESRISLAFLDQVKERLESSGGWDQMRAVDDTSQQHFRCLSTSDWAAYLEANTSKYIAAIEWIWCLDSAKRIGYEHSKVMSMLLTALPFAFDTGPFQTKSTIWQDAFQRQANGRTVLGMGIKRALASSGYGWLLPRIDWEQLTFRSRFTIDMAFTDTMLHDTYRKEWAHIKDSKDDYRRVEAAGQWLALYWQDPSSLDYIKRFLLVLLMKSYRKEIFRGIKHLLRPEHIQKAEAGQIILCPTSISQHFVDDWEEATNMVDRRRIKHRSINDLLELLWGFNDEIKRGPWARAPFRALCQRACELMALHCGPAEQTTFHDLIGRYFITTHWLIPYPTNAKLVQRNHNKHTIWVGIYHRRLAYSRAREHRVLEPGVMLPSTLNRPTWHYRPTAQHFKREYEHLTQDERLRLGLQGERARYYQDRERKRQAKETVSDTDLFSEDSEQETIECLPGRWRMVDWSLIPTSAGPFMSQVVSDYVDESLPFDGDLTSITQGLEQQWKIWQQLEEADEV